MKLFRKARRRRAGIYLVRTNQHLRPGRENGYVGRSNQVHLRRDCHLGVCLHPQHEAKLWTDLDPVWHVLWLPWWASFRPIQAWIEWMAVKVLLPRYNVQMNRRNPRWIPPSKARAQRMMRDRYRRLGYHLDCHPIDRAARSGRTLATVVGVVAIVVGIGMSVWTARP